MVTNEQARELLMRHGECSAQDASDWAGDIDLPTSIAEFYKSVGPADVSIESIGLTFSIPSLASLWDAQSGYRSHQKTGERFASWESDWIVVADAQEDPLPYVFSQGRISYCSSNNSGWSVEDLLPDLNSLVASLATLGDVAMGHGGELTDEDFDVRPNVIADAQERLLQLLGDSETVSLFLETAGWT